MEFDLRFGRSDIDYNTFSMVNIEVAKSIMDKLQTRSQNIGKSVFKDGQKFFVSLDGVLGYQYQSDGETKCALVVEVKDDERSANTLPDSMKERRFDSVAEINLDNDYSGLISNFRRIAAYSPVLESVDLVVSGGYDRLNYHEESGDDFVDSKVTLIVRSLRTATLKINRKTNHPDEYFSVKSRVFCLSSHGLSPRYVLDPGNQVTAALAYITDRDFLEEALSNVGEDICKQHPEASLKGILMYAAVKEEIDAPRREILTALLDDVDNRKMLMDSLLEPWASRVLPEPILSALFVNLVDLDCDPKGRTRPSPKV